MWKNRIVGHGTEVPDQILANPFNWRIHPDVQQDELAKVFQKIGWVQQVIINRRTGHLVDGHIRVQLAMWHEEDSVPVTYIDVSPAEEKLILAVLDPLSALAGRDEEKLQELEDDIGEEFPENDIDLQAILHKERRQTKGLTREVNECTCCQKRCKPGCGCYREDGDGKKAKRKR
jgi:hypothetical protein